MEKGTLRISENHGGISHELRWDGGRQVEWVAPDGSVRIPEEEQKEYSYPGIFKAAGKVYPNWRALCVKQDETGFLCKDLYGREVFYMSELFPCFDSYDFANETRRYRWFFIKENGKLTRIYHADGRGNIQITEDVRNLEDSCREQMQKLGWLK